MKSRTDIEAIIREISLGSILYPHGWDFRLLDKGDSYLLQLTYEEPDTSGPEPELRWDDAEPQHARKWYISPWMTESEIVRTAYKAVLCSLEHRLGEHFRYKGAKVYSPHFDVEALAGLATSARPAPEPATSARCSLGHAQPADATGPCEAPTGPFVCGAPVRGSR